jgi:short chain dehydrogenase
MSLSLFDLKGATALVTGSSRGLGRAIAEGMAKASARIVVNGTDPARVETAVAELRAAGFAAEGAAFDVTDEIAVVKAFEAFDRSGIEIDILVNNAGIQMRKPLVEFSSADWRKVIETNLTSAFIIGREAANRMIPRKRGKIINIRGQGRDQESDQVDGGGMGGERHPGQCDRSRLHADRHEPGADEQSRFQQLADVARPGQALGQSRRAGGRGDLPGLVGIQLRQRPDHLCRWRHAGGDVSGRTSDARSRHSRTEGFADRQFSGSHTWSG